MKIVQGMWLLMALLFSFSALAADPVYHLKLLAVQESSSEDGLKGSDADLYLELKPGSGRVFLETFPLTKLDTQISTRYAKEIACKSFKLDCAKYDYIFTIKAKSNIIGGPSAGAAIAALTAIATLDLDYQQDIAITGTINSGGIIGQVGGVKQKSEAAKSSGLRKMLIAKNNGYQNDNQTNVIDYAKQNLSLEVIEVNDLNDVIFQLTGVNLNHKEYKLVEDNSYTRIMGSLQNVLCRRSYEIETQISQKGYNLDLSSQEEITLRKGRADNSTINKEYYAAASYCFGLNIYLQEKLLQMQHPNRGKITQEFTSLEKKAAVLLDKINQEKIETISDLQTLMIVKERLSDVQEKIVQSRTPSLTIKELYSILAYAEERLYSAASWMQFLKMDGKKFIIDPEQLRQSCQQKILESQERSEYASLFVPLDNLNDKIAKAEQSLENEEYALCLIIASQAKAQADAVLSSLGLRTEIADDYIENKKIATERIIAENTAEGMFPILGYSYYQYALSLREAEPFSALLYLEYALEMSEIGIYFPEQKPLFKKLMVYPTNKLADEKWFYLVVGLVIGSALSFYFVARNPRLVKLKINIRK